MFALRKPILDRGRFPLGHFGRQGLLLLHGQRGSIEGVVVTLLERQSLLQQPLDEFAPVRGETLRLNRLARSSGRRISN